MDDGDNKTKKEQPMVALFLYAFFTCYLLPPTNNRSLVVGTW